jgi:hypothetical protein
LPLLYPGIILEELGEALMEETVEFVYAGVRRIKVGNAWVAYRDSGKPKIKTEVHPDFDKLKRIFIRGTHDLLGTTPEYLKPTFRDKFPHD